MGGGGGGEEMSMGKKYVVPEEVDYIFKSKAFSKIWSQSLYLGVARSIPITTIPDYLSTCYLIKLHTAVCNGGQSSQSFCKREGYMGRGVGVGVGWRL